MAPLQLTPDPLMITTNLETSILGMVVIMSQVEEDSNQTMLIMSIMPPIFMIMRRPHLHHHLDTPDLIQHSRIPSRGPQCPRHRLRLIPPRLGLPLH
jgi:hypothetical protein